MSDFAGNDGLEAANIAHRQGHLDQAGVLYAEAMRRLPSLRDAVEFNLKLMAARGWRGPGLDRFEQSVHQSGVYGQRLALLMDAVNFRAEHRKAVDRSETAIDKILGQSQLNREVSGNHKVSVIMPTFNRADIIADSIESVLNQDYRHIELIIVDDGSTDATRAVVESFSDDRIHYVYQDNSGAGAARNVGLAVSTGDIIAYLDTDNLWNPRYLSVVVKTFAMNPGRSAVYMDFVDYHVRADETIKLRSYRRPEFNHESLLMKPYIDLNTFAHRRELYKVFGGFDESLRRRQDYDLVLKYTWLRDPLHVPVIAALYLRDANLNQITSMNRQDALSPARIKQTIQSYFKSGLPLAPQKKKISVIVWDRCRNHFSKPYAVAEALSKTHEVELIAFDFFGEGVFGPLKGVNPPFVTKYFTGSDFPSFFHAMEAAMDAVTGDLMYVVKPRLPSFGLAMLVNEKKNIPFILEINDLETVVGSPRVGDMHAEMDFQDFDLSDNELLNPYSLAWSRLLDPLAKRAPVLMTHNRGLDDHYGNSSMYMRNLKDEDVYDPDRFDREEVRRELGFAKEDRVILFGGLIRKHKGIYELVELIERLADPRYKLLFIGSRVTPDQKALISRFGDRIVSLPSQDREGMARVNLAADLVILWLNPAVPASHYQFPYKATDAFAMRTPVIANSISDLGDLGRQNYLSLVDFGDWDGMLAAVRKVFDDPTATGIMTEAARRLYLRQFSYAAARANVEIAKIRLEDQGDAPYPISVEFGEAYRRMRNEVEPLSPGPRSSQNESSQVIAVYTDALPTREQVPHGDVVAFVLARSAEEGTATSRLIEQRADFPVATILIVEEDGRVPAKMALSRILSQSKAKYVLVTSSDALPSREWVRKAYESVVDQGVTLVRAQTGLKVQSRERWMHVFGARMDYERYLNQDPVLKEDLPVARDLLLVEGVLAHSPAEDGRDGATEDGEIHVVDVRDLEGPGDPRFHRRISVIMPCIDREAGIRAAKLLQSRAGVEADFVVVIDSRRKGFIRTLNVAARRTEADYVVYLAEDAFPGEDWLATASSALRDSGSKLLAFNCGKWHGRVAAFGMVDKSWAYSLYGDQILFEGYKSHRADNELTVIARAMNVYTYCRTAVLVENDFKKDFHRAENDAANFTEIDKNLFKRRYKKGFDGLVGQDVLSPLYAEYFEQRRLRDEAPPLLID